MLEVYHQLGFRFQWNIDSLLDDHAGDGMILGPRYMDREIVEGLPESLRSRSVFDPQFFLPNAATGGLSTYDFFPDVLSDGFKTNHYEESAAESAQKCVDFQLSNNFRHIVIPTRYLPGMPTDFIEQQSELFVNPFLKALANNPGAKSSVLQLIVNPDMMKDAAYATALLNWVTGLDIINGVYLIVEGTRSTKQIKDIDLLLSLLHFIRSLKENDLTVILGYLNTEAVLLALAEPDIVTMGSYENLRVFSTIAFGNEERGPMRGPNPRLYTSRLLQWIDYRYRGAILRAIPSESIFDETPYKVAMFEPTYKWHFTKPELYKHHFLVFSRQLQSLGKYAGRDRYAAFVEMAERALVSYAELEKRITFDPDSDGTHISAWLTAAKEFASEQGWRV
ncbi:MAG: hypothetical protein ACM3WU_05055 [Bacillota bacterium]